MGAGISVGSSYADGDFGPDTARAVSMIAIDSFGPYEDPGPAGIMTLELLPTLRDRINSYPEVASGICAAKERLVTATMDDMEGGVFRLDDVRCAGGFVQATITEYGWVDRSQIYYDAGIAAPTLLGWSYGPENGCAMNGVPPEHWEFFGCS
jgi:hypothetical protein